MMNSIKQSKQINEKKFYLEGSIIASSCPKCQKTHKYDDSISLSKAYTNIKVELLCNDCNHKWTEIVRLFAPLQPPINNDIKEVVNYLY